jgi:hypothetical protein
MDKFDEYKLFVEDTARFTSNRQTANNMYVAVNSIVLSASAFIIKDAGFLDSWKPFVVLPVLTAGVVVCLQWSRLIVKYKQLIGFRIRELKKIENKITNCHKMYEKEIELYPVDAEGRSIPGIGLNFSDRERWLPRIFLSVYSIYLLGSIIGFIVMRF